MAPACVAAPELMGPLGEGFLADGLKQRAIHDRRLLAGQDLVLVFDLADIKVIAQQIVQRATAERDPATRSPPWRAAWLWSECCVL
jgi:hypothetical protein